ncbi:hypothetical protein ACFQBU_12125 [Jhaorihella thermophila]
MTGPGQKNALPSAKGQVGDPARSSVMFGIGFEPDFQGRGASISRASGILRHCRLEPLADLSKFCAELAK